MRFNDLHPQGCFPLDALIYVDFAIYALNIKCTFLSTVSLNKSFIINVNHQTIPYIQLTRKHTVKRFTFSLLTLSSVLYNHTETNMYIYILLSIIYVVPIEIGSLFMKPRRHYLRCISDHHFEIKKLRINLGSSSHNPDFEGIERSRLIKRMILI